MMHSVVAVLVSKNVELCQKSTCSQTYPVASGFPVTHRPISTEIRWAARSVFLGSRFFSYTRRLLFNGNKAVLKVHQFLLRMAVCVFALSCRLAEKMFFLFSKFHYAVTLLLLLLLTRIDAAAGGRNDEALFWLNVRWRSFSFLKVQSVQSVFIEKTELKLALFWIYRLYSGTERWRTDGRVCVAQERGTALARQRREERYHLSHAHSMQRCLRKGLGNISWMGGIKRWRRKVQVGQRCCGSVRLDFG